MYNATDSPHPSRDGPIGDQVAVMDVVAEPIAPSGGRRLARRQPGAIRCRGFTRGVAQLGSALRSGRRGRGFESRHPDALSQFRGPGQESWSGPLSFFRPQCVRRASEGSLPSGVECCRNQLEVVGKQVRVSVKREDR